MRIPLRLLPMLAIVVLTGATLSANELLRELRLGRAGHAFDHLGALGEQAEAAAASGATIIYGTGLGAVGYQGLPPDVELAAKRAAVREYNRKAKQQGIRMATGYLCATSIVKLDAFDKNWTTEFRKQFWSPPSAWRQVDRQGQPLPSWYGGDYQPACMNHPDWRRYQSFMVRQQLETGHAGIFFDNPTVHPQGCYCEHCMEKFAGFLQQTGSGFPQTEGPGKLEALRHLAAARATDFLRFHGTIARDFLAAMRDAARTLNPDAVITCNNSLNSRDSFFSQCRTYGYNIAEMSKVEDWVTVEDMSSQPRTAANGEVFEYGPCYKMLHAISHGKPVVAVTLAAGDYHTAPNLMRLAMAEAAAHGASYLSWPTWPENQRSRMIASVRPQTDLLRQSEAMLNETTPRADVRLFLPFRNWLQTDRCGAMALATALSRANVQYNVVAEDAFLSDPCGPAATVLLLESLAVLTPQERAVLERWQKAGRRVITADTADWLRKMQAASLRSLTIHGPDTVRGVVRDQPGRAIVHLYNLNVERLSSFEDRIHAATDIKLTVKVAIPAVETVSVRTADAGGTAGTVKFARQEHEDGAVLEITIPRLEVSALLVIEP